MKYPIRFLYVIFLFCCYVVPLSTLCALGCYVWYPLYYLKWYRPSSQAIFTPQHVLKSFWRDAKELLAGTYDWVGLDPEDADPYRDFIYCDHVALHVDENGQLALTPTP